MDYGRTARAEKDEKNGKDMQRPVPPDNGYTDSASAVHWICRIWASDVYKSSTVDALLYTDAQAYVQRLVFIVLSSLLLN